MIELYKQRFNLEYSLQLMNRMRALKLMHSIRDPSFRRHERKLR